MKTAPPPDDNSWKQGDPLWDLLGQARRHEPSPWMPSNIVRAVRAESRFRNHNQLERLYLQLRLRWAFVLVLLFLGLTPLALWREYQWKTETELASSFFETFDAVESDAETEEITCLLASY